MNTWRRLLGGRRAQAMSEYVLLLSALFFAGGYAIMNWAPDALNAYQIYLDGFYLAIGYPIG